jgi:hypothetical protein
MIIYFSVYIFTYIKGERMSCDRPNIERILASFEHRRSDRVPNFEILIEDKHTSRMLGRKE